MIDTDDMLELLVLILRLIARSLFHLLYAIYYLLLFPFICLWDVVSYFSTKIRGLIENAKHRK